MSAGSSSRPPLRHQALERACALPGRQWPERPAPRGRNSSSAPRRPSCPGGSFGPADVAGLVEVAALIVGASDDGHSRRWLDEVLVFDPVVAVAAQALEGKAADEPEGLGAQAPGPRRLRRSLRFGAQALDGGPVRGGCPRRGSPGHRGVGEVLDPDPAAQRREALFWMVLRVASPRRNARRSHMPRAIWSALRWWASWQSEVGQGRLGECDWSSPRTRRSGGGPRSCTALVGADLLGADLAEDLRRSAPQPRVPLAVPTAAPVQATAVPPNASGNWRPRWRRDRGLPRPRATGTTAAAGRGARSALRAAASALGASTLGAAAAHVSGPPPALDGGRPRRQRRAGCTDRRPDREAMRSARALWPLRAWRNGGRRIGLADPTGGVRWAASATGAARS